MSTDHRDEFTSRFEELENNKDIIPESVYNALKAELDSDNYFKYDELYSFYVEFPKDNNKPWTHKNKSNHLFDFLNNNIPVDETKDSTNKKLTNYIQAIEEITSKNNELTGLNSELSSEIQLTKRILFAKETDIRKLKERVEELNGQIQQRRIDDNIPGYVKGVKEKLKQDDDHFKDMSYKWAVAGILFSILAILAAFITFYIKIDLDKVNTVQLLFYFTRGLLGIALLSWLSYYCLSNSKKYTHESIRRKDRQHALMFGEVFLQIYGSTATKDEAIKVFKDWNMSGDTAFSDQIQQPPSLYSMASSILDRKNTKNEKNQSSE